MPTYDYVCDACSHAFDLFQSMTANKKRKCPECGKPKLRRLIGSGAAVLFKGSGFYETDYKRKSGKPEKSESDGDSKSDSSSKDTSSKGDAKSSSSSDSSAKKNSSKKSSDSKRSKD